MKTEFMSLWDGFTTDQNAVLAATNRPSELDEAILGHFPQTSEIGISDRSERAKILKVILKGERIEEDIDYDNIARLCVGFTGSDIFELCKQAAYFPVRELFDDEKNEGETSQIPRALRQSGLEKALSNFKKMKGTNEHQLALQSPPWSRNTQPDDDDWVQDAILKICEIMNHIVTNNQSESQAQDP